MGTIGIYSSFYVLINLVYFNNLISNVEPYVVEAQTLHQFMTEPELGYYFGTSSQSDVPDYEVVYLPIVVRKNQREGVSEEALVEDDSVAYGFNAFGRQVNLKLRPNNKLLSPSFKVYRRDIVDDEDTTEAILEEQPYQDCHYLHKDEFSVAAISACHHQSVNGLVFLDNATLEIRPLTDRLNSLLKLREALEEPSEETPFKSAPHIVRRAPFISHSFHNDSLPIHRNLLLERDLLQLSPEFEPMNLNLLDNSLHSSKSKRATNIYTIEVALFFDEAGYKLFAPYFRYDEAQMRDMLLAYMNGVQALYHHPSLGTAIDITIVRLELMKRQASAMPHYDGERSKLLDSFCDYQKSINPTDDSNPEHWDMGLYVSGLDFYAYENGRKSGVTMGLATVGGVCLEKYACVIAELGTTNVFGKPYPSAGFTSVYILAHEMGHNLGMHHDGSGNVCPKEGYIMSPSRGTNGETLWSSCSYDVVSKLSWANCLKDAPAPAPSDRDHSRFLNTPGQNWGAKKQCEILLRDHDAVVSTAGNSMANMCQNLECRTPHRSGYYYAGPALEGTTCGNGKWCQGGSCVKVNKKKKPQKVVKGGWSSWRAQPCSSGCLAKAKGFQPRRRTCDNPKPVNSEEGCEGSSYDVVLCEDVKVCKKGKRKSVADYAAGKCKEFSKMVPELDPNGAGLQAPHEEIRVWMGCAIFCRRKDTGSYYTPRLDLNDLGIDPYFPDGTWCHNDGTNNYFCQQHHCLPENFRFTKTSIWGSLGEDVPLPGNAPPFIKPLSPHVQKYLSLGPDGRPLLTSLKPDETGGHSDEDWVDHDYLELPKDQNNEISSIDAEEYA